MNQGINPITLHGKFTHDSKRETIATLGRLWVGVEGEMHKYFTIMLWENPLVENPIDSLLGTTSMLGSVVLDEDEVIDALKHLFPNGELDREAPAQSSKPQ